MQVPQSATAAVRRPGRFPRRTGPPQRPSIRIHRIRIPSPRPPSWPTAVHPTGCSWGLSAENALQWHRGQHTTLSRVGRRRGGPRLQLQQRPPQPPTQPADHRRQQQHLRGRLAGRSGPTQPRSGWNLLEGRSPPLPRAHEPTEFQGGGQAAKSRGRWLFVWLGRSTRINAKAGLAPSLALPQAGCAGFGDVHQKIGGREIVIGRASGSGS